MCLDVHRHCLSCRVARIRHQGSQPEDSIFEYHKEQSLSEKPEKSTHAFEQASQQSVNGGAASCPSPCFVFKSIMIFLEISIMLAVKNDEDRRL